MENSYDGMQFDRILARTLATELAREARDARAEENTTLITSGTEECEES